MNPGPTPALQRPRPYQYRVSEMSSHRDRLQALSGSLRKGYPLAERLSDRQFEDLIRALARVPLRDQPRQR